MSTSFPPGVVVTAVEVSSEAWGLGLRPGDRITTTAGLAVEDCLAVTFSLSSASGPVAVTTHGQGGHRIITVEDPEGLLHDIRMEAITPQRCSNDCVYCFCKQNPPQARPSLLFRDEDHRMSFLTGAYVTLSALTDAELARIIRDRLSPLYVTVPATDEALRRRMLGVRVARPLLETLRTMVSAGITVHAQIVVCPGFNDGGAVERTVADLHDLRPGVASVALVPVGTTRYTPEARIRRPNPDELRHLLAVARRWSAVSSATEWVQASDEVYLALGRPVPSLQRYGEFPQLLTGVGMVRRFLEDAARIRRRAAPAWWQAHRIALITGTLFSPVLSRVVQALNLRWGARASVVAVENQYFGQYVTVAGLLGGREIRGSLRGLSVDVAILPGDALAAETLCFIDDMEFAELEDAAGVPVIVGDLISDALAAAGRRLL